MTSFEIGFLRQCESNISLGSPLCLQKLQLPFFSWDLPEEINDEEEGEKP
jgi:hypothetical protein